MAGETEDAPAQAEITIPKRFRKRLNKKSHDMQGSILATIKKLVEDETRPGLNVHRVQGTKGVWEAYVDGSNRLTFERVEGGGLLLRNHCNHDILERSP